MEIKWTNLIAFAMLLAAIVIALSRGPDIVAFINTMGKIGPDHSNDERTMGLIAFGLVGVLVVALAKILTGGEGHRR